jgi:hypothetical protein
LGAQNDTFLGTFVKLYANEKLQNDDEIAEILSQIYKTLKDLDRGFEGSFLGLRGKLAEAKEQLKVARKQLAITDPAKLSYQIR